MIIGHKIIDGKLYIELSSKFDSEFSIFSNPKKMISSIKEYLSKNKIKVRSSLAFLLIGGAVVGCADLNENEQEILRPPYSIVEEEKEEEVYNEIEEKEKVEEVKNLPKMTFLLLSGHAKGIDPGAVSGNRIEAEYSLQFCDLLEYYISNKEDINIEIIREDNDYALADEIKYLKKISPDYALSIHFNAGGGSGAEAIVPFSSQNISLVEKAIENYKKSGLPVRQTPVYSRSSQNKQPRKSADNIKVETDYYGIIREGSKIGVQSDIFEVEFIDNKSNMDYYDKNITKYIIGLGDAIVDYYLNSFVNF